MSGRSTDPVTGRRGEPQAKTVMPLRCGFRMPWSGGVTRPGRLMCTGIEVEVQRLRCSVSAGGRSSRQSCYTNPSKLSKEVQTQERRNKGVRGRRDPSDLCLSAHARKESDP